MAKDNEPKINLKKPAAGEDKTAKIPKPLKPAAADNQKVVLNSGTDSAIRPSDATRMAPAAIPPASTKKPVTPQPSTPPPASKDGKSKTIKLKPLKPTVEDENQEETISMERDSLMDGKMASSLGITTPKPPVSDAPATPQPSLDDEATIKIQKPQKSKAAHPTPNIPGAKETIKLRPSNTTPPPVPIPTAEDDENQDTVAMSKKTIRLIPKKPGETSADDSTQKTAKPSAPTVKLTDSKGPAVPTAAAPGPAVAPSAGKPKPSAPTVKLTSSKPSSAKATDSGSKKTLKLKSSTSTKTAAPPAAGPGGAPPAAPPAGKKLPPKTGQKKASTPSKGANPKAIMTIAAVLTLFLIAYYGWMVIGQWAEDQMDMTDNANVPGLSGKVKPPK